MSIYAQNNHFTKITLNTLHVGAYPHTANLLALNARGFCQLTPPAVEGLNHIQLPLVSKEWEKALQFHPDRAFVQYLLMGIQQGFRIGFDFNCLLSSSPINMSSANDHPSVVADYLANELHAGRIIGPIPSHLRDSIHISSFGVIPKRHQENKWRLILDLSHPLQASVNAGIPKVVIPGRIFLRRMLDLAASRHDLDHWIRLNEGFRSDFMWWDMFMESWNGGFASEESRSASSGRSHFHWCLRFMGVRGHMGQGVVSIPMVFQMGKYKHSSKRATCSSHSPRYSPMGQAVACKTHPVPFGQYGCSAYPQNQHK